MTRGMIQNKGCADFAVLTNPISSDGEIRTPPNQSDRLLTPGRWPRFDEG
jgi:hypothetical protein